MTNGRIWFLHDNSIYCTVLFYGDMYPRGKARYIIEAFKKGTIHTVEDFYHFVEKFHLKCYHHKAGSEEELVDFPRGICAENLDVTDNWDDYIYLINMSGRTQTIRERVGKTELPDHAMAIIHYQSVEKNIMEGVR